MARDIYKRLSEVDTAVDTATDTETVITSKASVRVYIKLIDAKTRKPLDGYGRIVGVGNGISAGIGDDGIGWLDVPKGTYKLILCYAKEGEYKPMAATLIVTKAGATFEYALKPC